MRHRRIGGTDQQPVWLLAFETGDAVIATLERFAAEQQLGGGHFHAIGAVRRATLAWYDLDTKRYEETRHDEQLEVCALTGNVSHFEGEPKIHVHCVLGRRDTTTVGGHLIEAEVRPTLELYLTGGRGAEREMDEEVGLPLL